MKDIVIAYLVSGQVVIARVDESQNTLLKPYEVMAVPGNGRLQVSMLPFGSMFGLLPPVPEINIEEFMSLLCPLADAPDGLAAEYIKASTGIVIPSPGAAQSLVQPA